MVFKTIECYLLVTRLNVDTFFGGRIYRKTYQDILELIPKIIIQDDPIYYIIYKIKIDIIKEEKDNDEYIKMLNIYDNGNNKDYNGFLRFIDFQLNKSLDPENKFTFYSVEQTLNTNENKIIIIGIRGKVFEIDTKIIIDVMNNNNKNKNEYALNYLKKTK